MGRNLKGKKRSGWKFFLKFVNTGGGGGGIINVQSGFTVFITVEILLTQFICLLHNIHK